MDQPLLFDYNDPVNHGISMTENEDGLYQIDFKDPSKATLLRSYENFVWLRTELLEQFGATRHIRDLPPLRKCCVKRNFQALSEELIPFMSWVIRDYDFSKHDSAKRFFDNSQAASELERDFMVKLKYFGKDLMTNIFCCRSMALPSFSTDPDDLKQAAKEAHSNSALDAETLRKLERFIAVLLADITGSVVFEKSTILAKMRIMAPDDWKCPKFDVRLNWRDWPQSRPQVNELATKRAFADVAGDVLMDRVKHDFIEREIHNEAGRRAAEIAARQAISVAVGEAAKRVAAMFERDPTIGEDKVDELAAKMIAEKQQQQKQESEHDAKSSAAATDSNGGDSTSDGATATPADGDNPEGGSPRKAPHVTPHGDEHEIKLKHAAEQH